MIKFWKTFILFIDDVGISVHLIIARTFVNLLTCLGKKGNENRNIRLLTELFFFRLKRSFLGSSLFILMKLNENQAWTIRICIFTKLTHLKKIFRRLDLTLVSQGMIKDFHFNAQSIILTSFFNFLKIETGFCLSLSLLVNLFNFLSIFFNFSFHHEKKRNK